MYQNESIFRKCFEAKAVVIRTEWPLSVEKWISFPRVNEKREFWANFHTARLNN